MDTTGYHRVSPTKTARTSLGRCGCDQNLGRFRRDSIRKSCGDIMEAMLDVLIDIEDHMLFLDESMACFAEELRAEELNAMRRKYNF